MTNPIPEGDLTAAENEELLLLCGHAPGPEPLSPTAQAVLDAFRTNHTGQGCLAAALRAVADQCAEGATHWELYAIAAELEGQDNDSIPHRLNKESDY